jgi:hypothetical protein
VKDETILSLAGIGAVTTICVTCLMRGIDSVVLASCVAVISGLAGYSIKAWRKEGGETLEQED